MRFLLLFLFTINTAFAEYVYVHSLLNDSATSTGSAWSSAKVQEQINAGPSGAGQANTASNTGTGGVGVWARKTGVDLEFKNLAASSTKLNITDDVGNDNVKIGINEPALDVSNMLNFIDWTADYSATSTININNLQLPTVGAATQTVEDMNTIGHSAGLATAVDPENIVTTAGGTLVNATAFTAFFRTSNSPTAQLVYAELGATLGLSAPTADTNYFVVADYNAGSPQVTIGTTDTSNNNTIFLLSEVYNEGGAIHEIINDPHRFGNHAEIMNQRHWDLNGFGRASGSSIGETGTLKITVTAGNWWGRSRQYTTPAFDTSATDFATFYYNDGAWQSATSTDWDNLQYNNFGVGLAALSNKRFANYWVYQGVTDGDIRIVYGIGNYSNLTNAEAAGIPANLPPIISTNAYKLIGKCSIKKSDSSCGASGMLVSSFESAFSQASVNDHSQLSNLQGGTTSEYYHLTSAQHTAMTSLGSGEIVFGDASSNASSSPQLFYDSALGRIGSGTSTPQGKFHLINDSVTNAHYPTTGNVGIFEAAEARLQIVAANTGTGASSLLLSNAQSSTDNRHWVFHHNGVSAGNGLEIGYMTSTNDGFDPNTVVPDMYIKNTGEVGIGTSDPNHNLVVGDDIGAFSSDNSLVIGDSSPITTGATLFLANTTSSFGSAIWDNTNEVMKLQTWDAGGFNADTLVLDGGNVGIGTTVPTSLLDMQKAGAGTGIGASITNLTNSAGSHSFLHFKNTGTRESYIGINRDTNTFTLSGGNGFSSSQDWVNVDLLNGNVGIGTTSASSKLHVNGGITIADPSARPTCDVTRRGLIWVERNGSGVKDTLAVCLKDAGDAYAWRTIY